MNDYIFAVDERGVTRWPSRTNTYAIGGFVVQREKLQEAIVAWLDIKYELCGDRNCELKWSHFFDGPHQRRTVNPLSAKSPDLWREQAEWALQELFSAAHIFPITALTIKNEASSALFKTLADGRQIIDSGLLWESVVSQFALYLEEHKGHGEIWVDHLGSPKEENRRQIALQHIQNMPWQIKPENQRLYQVINPVLKFFNSSDQPAIQLADFVSGVIWAAAEGDEHFFHLLMDKYVPGGRRTYGILIVQ